MSWIEVWFSDSNAISKAKLSDISSNGIEMHLIVYSKRSKSLMSILIDVLSQVLHYTIRQFARSMSCF